MGVNRLECKQLKRYLQLFGVQTAKASVLGRTHAIRMKCTKADNTQADTIPSEQRKKCKMKETKNSNTKRLC